MKKNYIILLIAILFSGTGIAQTLQKNYINYQGVARSAGNELMASEDMTIGISLRFGASNEAIEYEENHALTTDANGVFSLKIGSGSTVSGDYDTLPWGSLATYVTVAINGNEVGTTEMMAVPYAISSGDADDQSAAEVPYDNVVSGLTATNTQEAIDELVGSGAVDADADPTNEIQTISFDIATNELSLTDGGIVTLPSSGTDADPDPENELQTLAFDAGTNELSLSDGNTVTIPSGGTDADADPTNEIQTISFDAGTNELSLSGGGTVTIPSGGTDADADPENEIDVTRRHGLLVGDDGIVDGLVGTADGQVAKWDAALGNWVAGTDETGGAGGSSLWTEDGDKIYYNTGNVGIGAANPIGKLQISKNSNSAPFLNLHSTSGDEINVRYSKMENSLNWNQHAVIGTDEASSRMNFNFYDSGTDHPIITLRGNRKMGVNNANPQSTLDIAGNIRSTDLAGTGQRNVMADADGNLVIGAGGGGSSLWMENGGHINYDTGRVGIGTGANVPVTRVEIAGIPGVSEEVGFTNALFTITDNEFGGGPYRLIMGGSSIQTTAEGVLSSLRLNPEGGNIITGAGNFGIGVSPNEKLDVDGTIRTRDLAGTGQRNVMADADGNLVIGAGGTGGSSLWEEDADGINRTSGSIGIGGVSSSNSRLRVVNGTAGYREGIYSYVFHSGFKVGISAHALSRDDENAFGMRSSVTSEADATAWAYRADMNGAGTGTKYGFFSKIHPGAGGLKYGLYTDGEDRNYFSGSLGIGTETPSAKLHVDGDIRSTDLAGTGQRNVMADADGNLVIGAGGGGSLWAQNGDKIHYNLGNAGIGTDNPLAPLHIITSAINPLRIESTSADNYIRFSNTNGYRGYVGVFSNDNDMDLGTGLGNTTGKVHLTTLATPKLTVAADGDVGIGTTNPTAKLDVDGDIKTSGEVHTNNTGNANMLPIAYGYIDASGNILSGSGNFTVSKLGALLGLYSVTIPDEDDQANWIVMTTINHTAPGIASVSHSGSIARNFSVNTWRLNSTRFDSSFSFVVYKR